MGMRANRMCSNSGCYATAVPPSRFCARHQNDDKKRDRDYKAGNPLRKLYGTVRWKVTRRLVLARDVQCTYVENGARCWQLSTDVHHIIPAQKFVADGGDFFDMDNLAGLCHQHHSRATATEVGFAGWQKTMASRKQPRGKITPPSVSRGKRSA